MSENGRHFWQTLVVGVMLLFGLASCSIGGLTASPTATTAPAAATATTAATTAPTVVAQSGQPLSQPVTTASATTASVAAATPATAATPAATTGGTALPDVASVAAKVRPATVLVLNIVQSQPGRTRSGGPSPAPGTTQGGTDVPQGAGTGFIIDASGIIVTNNHVVEGAQKLTVQMPPPDGRVFTATLIGTAPNNDLAVLKIDGTNLPTVPLGNSSQLQIGEWVVAIGNALALKGGPTVTAGVVSATGRDEQEPVETQGQTPVTLYDLIQTDAAINPGNSGGPLVNMKGEVVGINTLGSTEAQGIGFAISIDSAKPIIQQLIQTGKVAVPYLGVQVTSVTSSIAAANSLPRNSGVYVQQVVSGTPAARGGLQQGDIIFGMDNDTVADQSDFQKVLLKHKPGDTVNVKINRNGTEQTIQVTLGEKPQANSAVPTT
jgi:serine protease Do